jgi:hypothetical protein
MGLGKHSSVLLGSNSYALPIEQQAPASSVETNGLRPYNSIEEYSCDYRKLEQRVWLHQCAMVWPYHFGGGVAATKGGVGVPAPYNTYRLLVYPTPHAKLSGKIITSSLHLIVRVLC